MSIINILRNEYRGSDAWERFVAVFRSGWDTWPEKESYLALLGDEEMPSY
jgi:hypothetical protein